MQEGRGRQGKAGEGRGRQRKAGEGRGRQQQGLKSTSYTTHAAKGIQDCCPLRSSDMCSVTQGHSNIVNKLACYVWFWFETQQAVSLSNDDNEDNTE